MTRVQLSVQAIETVVPGWGPTLHIKVRRVDGKSGIAWEALQEIKNEYAGPEARAIEVYPRESDLFNEQNIRHLWVVPEDVVVPNIAGYHR